MSLEPAKRQSSCLTYDFSSTSQVDVKKMIEALELKANAAKVGHVWHGTVRQIGSGLTPSGRSKKPPLCVGVLFTLSGLIFANNARRSIIIRYSMSSSLYIVLSGAEITDTKKQNKLLNFGNKSLCCYKLQTGTCCSLHFQELFNSQRDAVSKLIDDNRRAMEARSAKVVPHCGPQFTTFKKRLDKLKEWNSEIKAAFLVLTEDSDSTFELIHKQIKGWKDLILKTEGIKYEL